MTYLSSLFSTFTFGAPMKLCQKVEASHIQFHAVKKSLVLDKPLPTIDLWSFIPPSRNLMKLILSAPTEEAPFNVTSPRQILHPPTNNPLSQLGEFSRLRPLVFCLNQRPKSSELEERPQYPPP
ncbi:hypothetical protein DSO57_1001198 [Entomophthora muscae]|uniref:Uncharacterized protein n=1 Tax=Entomophthora muscae TaxID=34485 RepID=A0ACC2TW55_9FUNG|nr:hypothetical protein DSO57_1001198 [Entomophthora muscae]